MTAFKPQRMRDPVHNLVEFSTDQFEHTLWRVIQTPPFQRLRRIRQLGFSEFVFPGATHTRFAHSIGVFHVARALMRVIRRHIDSDSTRQFGDYQAKVALAAALLVWQRRQQRKGLGGGAAAPAARAGGAGAATYNFSISNPLRAPQRGPLGRGASAQRLPL
jgi:hypothetical protein